MDVRSIVYILTVVTIAYVLCDHAQTRGVHQHFGVYYAMGIGLVFEGLMGCFYHICPNNANFQFGKSSNNVNKSAH